MIPRLQILLLSDNDQHVVDLADAVRSRGFAVETAKPQSFVKGELCGFDVVILDLTANSPEVWNDLRSVCSLANTCARPPAIIAISRTYSGPRMQLDVERLGARFALSDRFAAVIEAVDFVVLESRQIDVGAPHFQIVHRLPASTDSTAHSGVSGDEILWVLLIHRARHYLIPLSRAERLLINYLAHYRLPQDATQIELGVRRSDFCVEKSRSSGHGSRLLSRPSVRVYVQRIREAIQNAMREAGARMDGADVLLSEKIGNRTVYKLRAQVTWAHVR